MIAAPATLTSPARQPVLVVDDHEDLRAMLSLSLHACGFEVVTAKDGREALEMLQSGLRPGVILLDMMMPGVDGFGVLAALEADTRLADIPVAVMSGSHFAPHPHAVCSFRKPFELSTVIAFVQSYVPIA